jgi:nitroreductase
MKKIILIVLVVLTVVIVAQLIATVNLAKQNCVGDFITTKCRVDIVSFISSIYSPRQFKAAPVSHEKIQLILEAGHKAPSARNAQPWHFTVVRNKDVIDQIMNNVQDGEVLIVVSGPAEPSRFSIDFDVALATQNMFIVAQALELAARMYVVPIANLNEKLLPTLNIPTDYKAYIVLRIGYEADGVDAVTAASPRQPLETKVNYID